MDKRYIKCDIFLPTFWQIKSDITYSALLAVQLPPCSLTPGLTIGHIWNRPPMIMYG